MRYSSSISPRKRRGRTEYIAVVSYYDESGERQQKRKTAFSSSEAKRLARDLENEYLEGGEEALYSDDLTFADLASHCQQNKVLRSGVRCRADRDRGRTDLPAERSPLVNI